MHTQISNLVSKAKSYLPGLNEKRLRAAYNFAREAHHDQKRMDGSDYLSHPLEAMNHLMRLHVDEDALIACLLHDVPEDTKYELKDIEKKFGKKVSFLVDGVTKLSKVKYRDNMAERQIESLKKFFLHSAKDLRIILIKLADRLHNMQTLDAVRKEKQYRIAKETMEIYVPIANLLGIWEFKSELEDLCFQYIFPKEFTILEKQFSHHSQNYSRLLKETSTRLKKVLKEHVIPADIEARPKSLYSTFRKMMDTGKRLQDLNDILAYRIIVDDRESCYRVLGIIHELFRPKSGRIKDYIAVPKPNGYQSLHTTVFGVDGTPTEFQIRTYDMHIEAEYGIAAHYFYKQKHELSSKERKEIEKRSAWVQRVLDLQKELKSNFDFIENLKVDVFKDRIFVFTPQGDVVDLPKGANGVDFAYHIHTHLGDQADGLFRNGKRYPITTKLQTGDTVQIIIASTQKYPHREWLGKAKTALAQNKIRTALKKQTPVQARHAGKAYLSRVLHRYGCDDLASLTKEQQKELMAHFEAPSWDALMETIGYGLISHVDIVKTLYTEDQLLGKPNRRGGDFRSPVSNIEYLQGDLVVPSHLESIPYYNVNIEVTTEDRVGLLRDVGIELASLNVNIHRVGVRAIPKKDTVLVDLVIEVVDFQQLREAFDAIESVEGVLVVHSQRPSPKAPSRSKRS